MPIKKLLLVMILLLNNCVSVWPNVCTHSWRGVVDCKCQKEVKFRITGSQAGKRVTIECDGVPLPISADSTKVISQ